MKKTPNPNVAFMQRRGGYDERISKLILKSFIASARPGNAINIKAMDVKHLRASSFVAAVFTEYEDGRMNRYVKFINNLVYRYESFLHPPEDGEWRGLYFVRAKHKED